MPQEQQEAPTLSFIRAGNAKSGAKDAKFKLDPESTAITMWKRNADSEAKACILITDEAGREYRLSVSPHLFGVGADAVQRLNFEIGGAVVTSEKSNANDSGDSDEAASEASNGGAAADFTVLLMIGDIDTVADVIREKMRGKKITATHRELAAACIERYNDS